ncbi:MAG TPA: hypothetical protein VL307_12275 [Chitinophagaceae bacterium]|nr:hypothetical protein [Chitinophagaceae bacterium]
MIKLERQDFIFDESQPPYFVDSVSSHQFGKKITLNDLYASGNYQLLEFQNGFYAYSSNYIMHEDFDLDLSVPKESFLALHINQIQAGVEFKFQLNNASVSYDDKIITSLFLTTSEDNFRLKGSSGACINRLKIMIPRSWLETQLPFFDDLLLQRYLQLQYKRLYIDTIDSTYRTLVNKVMNTEDNACYLSVTQDIVTVITERFFSRLHHKLMKNLEDQDWSDRLP